MVLGFDLEYHWETEKSTEAYSGFWWEFEKLRERPHFLTVFEKKWESERPMATETKSVKKQLTVHFLKVFEKKWESERLMATETKLEKKQLTVHSLKVFETTWEIERSRATETKLVKKKVTEGTQKVHCLCLEVQTLKAQMRLKADWSWGPTKEMDHERLTVACLR